nr:E3 ubiquitin-protein ligase UPL5-like [Tanacetum cinerariifolium]
MGRGKGNPAGWIARVSTGQIPFEMDGVSLSNAQQWKNLVHALIVSLSLWEESFILNQDASTVWSCLFIFTFYIATCNDRDGLLGISKILKLRNQLLSHRANNIQSKDPNSLEDILRKGFSTGFQPRRKRKLNDYVVNTDHDNDTDTDLPSILTESHKTKIRACSLNSGIQLFIRMIDDDLLRFVRLLISTPLRDDALHYPGLNLLLASFVNMVPQCVHLAMVLSEMFLTSGVPEALVMLYMSPNKQRANVSVKHFVNVCKDGLLSAVYHEMLAPVVLHFCVLLRQALVTHVEMICAEEDFWTSLKPNKVAFCYLIVNYVKRGDKDYKWILDRKDMTNFISRRHLAMMLLHEVTNDYNNLHEMLINR